VGDRNAEGSPDNRSEDGDRTDRRYEGSDRPSPPYAAMKPVAKYAWFLVIGVMAVGVKSTTGGPGAVMRLSLTLSGFLLLYQAWFSVAYEEVAMEYGVLMFTSGVARVESWGDLWLLLLGNAVLAVLFLMAAVGL